MLRIKQNQCHSTDITELHGSYRNVDNITVLLCALTSGNVIAQSHHRLITQEIPSW